MLLISIECSAQEFIYENFGVDEGLPSSEVYDVYQDKEGYMWFATDKGLSRYNGYEFQNFNTNDGLTGNVVLRFYPQSNGQVWCYSFHNKSLFYFDEIFKGFKTYKYNNILAKNLQESSIVKSVYLDTINNLHIGGHQINGELIIHNDGVATSNYSTEDYFLPLISIQKSTILKKTLDSGTAPFFFTTSDTNKIKKSVSNTNYKSPRIMADWLVQDGIGILMSDSIVEIVNQNNENIIIRYEHSPIGIKMIDSACFFVGYEFGGGKIVDKRGVVLREFLKDKSVSNLLIDHEGGYWFTTLDSGIYYVENPLVAVYRSINQKSRHINSLAKNNDKELLIGYKNGNISKLLKNRTTLVLDQPEKSVHAFVEHDSIFNKTYLYNNYGLKNATTSKKLLTGYILKLSEPIDSTIFVSSINRFYEINKNGAVNTRKSRYRIHDVCIWNKDTLISTPLGVFKFENGSTISLSGQSKLYNYRSEDIDVNSNNDILFVATQGAGVIVNDGEHIYNITRKDGLNSNIVNEIYIENDTTIWACTNNGINRIEFHKNGKIIAGISKKEGLLSDEIEDIEIISDTVWVGTKQGLCYFPKSQLTLKSNTSSYLKLKEVYVNSKSKEITGNVILTHKENEIDFVLEGISYANKDNLHYQYRLNNNLNWSSTKERVIHFSSLAPDTYIFESKMCFGDKDCSEKIITYQFTIRPPFWKTGWFSLLVLCVLVLLIYLFFKVRVLTYNKDITRELIRLLIKRLKRKEKYFSFRENGNQIRIKTHDILFIKSAANYIDIHTENKTYTVRMSIGKFLEQIPDKIEYVRMHRSYIVRIDKITSKSKNEVFIKDLKIPVSQSFLPNLKDIHF